MRLLVLLLTIGISQTVYCANVPGADWLLATSAAPWGQRGYPAQTVFKNKVYLLGGERAPGVYLPDVWTSANGISWTLTQGSADWSARSGLSVVTLGRTSYVLGGNDGNVNNDVWSSQNMRKWKRLTNNAPWSPRWHHCSVMFSNLMGHWRR